MRERRRTEMEQNARQKLRNRDDVEGRGCGELMTWRRENDLKIQAKFRQVRKFCSDSNSPDPRQNDSRFGHVQCQSAEKYLLSEPIQYFRVHPR